MDPPPDFSVYNPRKIRLSAMATNKKEVAVFGVAATVDVTILGSTAPFLRYTIAPLQ